MQEAAILVSSSSMTKSRGGDVDGGSCAEEKLADVAANIEMEVAILSFKKNLGTC